MKKNSLYIFIASAAMVLPAVDVAAQSIVQQGDVTIQTNILEQRGDSLYLDMRLTIQGKNTPSRKSADFTPVLVSESRSKRLPKVSVKGRSNYKSYSRAIALMSKKEQNTYASAAPYKVMKGYKKGIQVVDYNIVIPYEKWMSSAYLNMERDDCGCGKSQTTNVKMLASRINMEQIIILERYNITPALAYVQPEAEIEKRRMEQGASFLDFAVNKTVINPTFGSNTRELQKIRNMIEMVQNDKGVSIKGIVIIGYASPEGSLAGNKRLSEGRAKALQSYLQDRYQDISKSMYTVRFGGENWDDLQLAVKASDMPYKQEVLDIIERYGVEAGRKNKLIALRGGDAWRYMLKGMFPSLRKAVVNVDYDVKNFDVNEAKEVVKTRPQNLSLNEMFAVAQTYEKGSEEFNELFEIAVRMFPQDPIANMNAAVTAIGRKDYVSAERYLNNVKIRVRIPEYDNAIGMLVMMRDGDYNKAEEYFKVAEQAGLTAATENLKEIAKMRQNINQIREAELKSRK